ncbi:hypothetical protein D3C77_510510 [compost metagenome]
MLVFIDADLDQCDQVVVVLEHQLLGVVEQEDVILGQAAQAFEVGADAVADLAGVDLCPGQLRVGCIAQAADGLLTLDGAGEVSWYGRHPHLATERVIDLVDVGLQRFCRGHHDLIADGDLASFHQFVQFQAFGAGLGADLVNGTEESVDAFGLAQGMLLGGG